MTIQRHFKLALTAGHTIPLVINANQYDSGEQWLFTLYNDGVRYTPSSGAIVGIKADRLGIINTGTVDANGRVVINETRQMTAAVGKNVFELLIDDQTHGTANFMVLVEPRPGDNADLSESDYSLFEEAIQGTSQAAIKAGVQEWMDENLTNPTNPVIDETLSLSGAAADAKKTGDEIDSLKSAIAQSTGMSTEFKVALENLLSKVAYIDANGQTYLDALHTAMYPPAKLTSISAVYTQSGTVYDTDSLDDLKTDLVVTAFYDNGTSEIVSTYTFSGTLTEGTSTITVSYGGKTATFTVTVANSISINWSETDEYKLSNDGSVVSGGDYVSDFTYIPKAGTYLFEDAKSPWIKVCIYNNEKTFIRQYPNNTSKPYYIDLEGDTYVRVDVYPSSNSTEKDGTYTTPQEEFNLQNTGRLWSYSKGKFNKTTGKFEFGVADANNRCKFAYIPVTPNTSYTLSKIGDLAVTYLGIFEYDSNHNLIKFTEKASGDNTVTVTADTAYVRISAYAPNATSATDMDEQVSFAKS